MKIPCFTNYCWNEPKPINFISWKASFYNLWWDTK
jgi:hypothetical protein